VASVFKRKDRNGKPRRVWSYRYKNYLGIWISGAGWPDKKKTQSHADSVEAEHRAIAKGEKPVPERWVKGHKKPVAECVEEFLAHGKLKGGRKGRPWSPTHARMRESYLRFWIDKLGLKRMSDLDGILGLVDKALGELRAEGKSAGTCNHYLDGLASFCTWACKRRYIQRNALAEYQRLNNDEKIVERCPSPDEIERLLACRAPERRLLYLAALCTGLRASELAALERKHLNYGRGGLDLEARWTKNRERGFLPLPAWLLEQLGDAVDENLAGKQYAAVNAARTHRGAKPRTDIPNQPLLYVASHPSRELSKDLKVSGIDKYTTEGRFTFKSFRVAYISYVVQSGASVKEAQALARHASPNLTLNIYARARDDQLSAVAHAVGEEIKALGQGRHLTDIQAPPKDTLALSPCPPRVPPLVQPESTKDATQVGDSGYALNTLVEAAGIEPASRYPLP